MSSATAKWVALALLGVAIAGGVAFAASRLVSEQIGIASESVSAGEELAPVIRSAAGSGGEGAARSDRVADDERTRRNEGGTAGTGTPTTTAPPEPSGPSADQLDEREDAREDELKELEDIREDELKELEDRLDDERDAREDARDD